VLETNYFQTLKP